MRYIILVFALISFNSCKSIPVEGNGIIAKNPVIAHRGAWKSQNLPQNSIASLKQAISLGCAGSEFDVRMTADHVLVVNHDADHKGLLVEEHTYLELSKYKLPNGEILPTLKDYLLAGMEDNPSTGLVCEIKPTKTDGRNVLLAENVIALVKELKAERYISYYISFSYEILEKIIEIDPKAKTQLLDGSRSPIALKETGITGLDYAANVYKKNPKWIKNAKEQSLKLNVWTVNNKMDMDWFLNNGFDYITTDEPEILFERLQN